MNEIKYLYYSFVANWGSDTMDMLFLFTNIHGL